MTHRYPTRRLACIVGLAPAVAVAVVGLWSTRATAQTGDLLLDATLAERFALLADEAVSDRDTPEPVLLEAAAMLDLARQFKPREVRFARSSADVLLRLGERDRALAALGALRQLDPRDQLAMIQFVDLTVDKMETAEAKAAYLQQIVGAAAVAAEVRSHAATLLMDLCFQRSQDQQGLAAMSTALSLNPQNIAALNVAYRVAAQTGIAAERGKALGAILRASPADPANLIAMADECAAAGDYDNAGFYYSVGLGVYANRGETPPIDDFIDFASVKMFAGETALVEALAGQAAERAPTDGRLYSLQLLIAMTNGKTLDELGPQIAAARGVHLAELAGLSLLLKEPQATQMPATNPAVPMPDVRADVATLTAEGGDPNGLRNAYAVVLAEQLWFDAYFRAAPVDAASLEALRTLLGPTDPVVVRLEGWALLSAGQIDAAVVKLGAIADRDGYAKLGLIGAATAKGDADKAKSLLTELVTNRPSGMYGAHVAVEAKRQNVRVEMTAAERQIAGLAGSMKNPIENLLNNPRGSYLLSARPVSISFGPGDPLLAEIRLTNNGTLPITIGPGCLVESRFSVDLTTRGDTPRNFPAAVIGQWTGLVRLLPQQTFSQVMRIDRGAFGDFLRQYPTPMFAIKAMVTVNPLFGEKGSFPAAGGQQTTVGDVIERKPSPLHVDAFRTSLIERLGSANAVERMSVGEFAATVVPLLTTQGNNEGARTLGVQLSQALEARRTAEQVPAVRSMVDAAKARAAAEPALIQALVGGDEPVGQVMGLWYARNFPADFRRDIAGRVLSRNPTGPTRELAEALALQADLPATPPPATQPAQLTNAPRPDLPNAR